MKYNFTFIEPINRGALPLESSVTITSRGIQAGKRFREALKLDAFKYVQIGIDEEAKAACVVPVNSPESFTAAGEFGGRHVADKLLSLLGRKPFVSIENGVGILTSQKPVEDPPEEKLENNEVEIVGSVTSNEQPKKRGRPKKEDAKAEPKEERKEACENCNYHKPVPGQAGRIKCEKNGQTKNVDDYCFHYEPELK